MPRYEFTAQETAHVDLAERTGGLIREKAQDVEKRAKELSGRATALMEQLMQAAVNSGVPGWLLEQTRDIAQGLAKDAEAHTDMAQKLHALADSHRLPSMVPSILAFRDVTVPDGARAWRERHLVVVAWDDEAPEQAAAPAPQESKPEPVATA